MKPYLIAVGGPSGAGKSYLSHALASALGDAAVLPLDCYYNEYSHLSFERRCELNFDHPDSMDEALMNRQLEHLADGLPVKCPVYNFGTHSRERFHDLFRPRRYVILEGIFALHFRRVRELSKMSIFVCTPDDECYSRRLCRDTKERGRTAESVEAQYSETVRPMAYEYVWPTRHYAHLVIPGNQDIARSVEQVLESMPAAFAERAAAS